jgi:hypothetical protein
MRQFKLTTTFVFFALTFFGQDSTKTFEIGSTLATINSFRNNTYFARDRAQFEFINGLFFRYSKKRHAFRALISFSDNYSEFRSPPIWSDAESGNVHNKDLRIGVGAQYSILKKNWLYIFTDISYRYLHSIGEYYGGITSAYDKFRRKSNGADLLPGLGFRLKVYKRVYLSPEIGLNGSFKFVNAINTSILNGQQIKFSYFDFFVNPIARIQLTFKL